MKQSEEGDALRYDVEIDLENKNTSHAQLALLIGEGKRVLEVGPATGYLSRVLRERGCTVVGVEIDPIAAKEAERYCERVIVGNIETLDFEGSFGEERFDVVVYGDVLEHLVDPEQTLRRTAEILAPGGCVVASIPNVTHGSVRLALLSGSFPWTEVGILDRTHLRFFDRRGVEDLFRLAGYEVSDLLRTTTDVFNTELALDEGDFPPHLVDLVRNAPEAKTYQFVVRARPAPPEETAPFHADVDIQDRDGAMAPMWQLEEHVSNLETQNQDQRELIAQKDAMIWERDDVISAGNETIKERTEAVAWLEQHVADIKSELGELQRSHDAVVNSAGFRALHAVRDWIDRKAPWGTRRRSFILTPARAARLWLNDGKRAFFLHLLRPWRWVPRMFERAWPDPEHLSPMQKYTLWLETKVLAPKLMRAAKRRAKRFSYRPKISIIMPVYNAERGWLRSAIASVEGQVYDNWELCMVDDGSTRKQTLEVLREHESATPRIKVKYLKRNAGIAIASNEGLAMATGEFVGFLDHDDELKKNALYEVVKLLNERRDLDYIYSDEDKRELDDALSDPFFKPDWSPDLLMSVNYCNHFSVHRKALLDKIGGFREGFDGSQDHDLVLRATEVTDRIAHIPLPLYTWRKVPGSAAVDIDSKGYAYEAGKRVLLDTLERRGYGGTVEEALVVGRYRARYKILGEPKVTIIIPTRDKVDMLRRCIESVRARTTYQNHEIMVVDNESAEPETLSYLSEEFGGRVLSYPHPFNYARMMNFAVSQVPDADFVLFLNNDTEVIREGWLEALLEHAQRPDVAATGGRLYYGEGQVQHEGIIIGWCGGSAGNVDFAGFDAYGETIRNASAVTGACMMVRRETYLDLGGMEERLGVAFNDVDFCLRAREKGYFIVYTPYAELFHYESSTRGSLHPEEDERFFRERWGNPGDYQDPYYNPNLDIITPFRLRLEL